MNRALWVIQALLALLFAFAGVMKLVTPGEALVAQSGFSILFMRFIGLVELLGGLGLVLPGLTGIRPELTPLAAAGLAIVMVGAVVVSISMGGIVAGLFPVLVLVLLVFIAAARWGLIGGAR